MFGFELQTNANTFLSGVKPREVAWRSNLVTLEGDECVDHPDKSELEFVTVPCPDLATALEAIRVAMRLSFRLREDAQSNGGVVAFAKGTDYAGGRWELTGSAAIGNPSFEAQPQVTIGVPLARLPQFITDVLTNVRDEGTVKDLEGMDRQAQQVFPEFKVPQSAELTGFLWACRYLVLRTRNLQADDFKVESDGTPKTTRARHSARVFQFNSNYLYDAGFGTKDAPRVRIVVDRDSPKSLFELLHRTDFHSMFRTLSEKQRDAITLEAMILLLWPYNEPDFKLLPFPYRADPLDKYALPRALQYEGVGWPDAKLGPAASEKWFLVEHGPLFSEWCGSIIGGSPDTEKSYLKRKKDLMSPPRGLRGRPYVGHETFPAKGEDKSSYYGMGVFPVDRDKSDAPLAIYEHRNLRDDRTIATLLTSNRLVASARWDDLVDLVVKAYVRF